MSDADDRNRSDSVDPSDFVQRIRELGEQRDQEDAERFRQLEDEIKQGRSERLARRAERQRSISPQKPSDQASPRSRPSSSVNTPTREPSSFNQSNTPTMASDRPGVVEDSLSRLTGGDSQTPGSRPSSQTQSPSASPTRRGALRWNRRPESQSSPTRPMSTDTPDTGSGAEESISRDQIAKSLGSKDPNWFKQTADRGMGSAAYRKSANDDVNSPDSFVGGRRPLPGMGSSRESTTEPSESLNSPTSPAPESVRSSTPSNVSDSARGSAAFTNRFSSNTSVSRGSVLPMRDSQKFAPPGSDISSPVEGQVQRDSRGLMMSPSQRQISPERSPSPTKGAGGFVQSAMLRRNESVSKRVGGSGTSLSRQNSTASNSSRPTGSLSRENSTEPTGSRPGSGHSSTTVTQDFSKRFGQPETDADGFKKPTLPRTGHSRGKSITSPYASSDQFKDGENTSAPSSPTKRSSKYGSGLDRGSWLINQLNKQPEPAKATPVMKDDRPDWMKRLSKQNADRSRTPSPVKSPAISSTDESKEVAKEEVEKPAEPEQKKIETPKPTSPEVKEKPVSLSSRASTESAPKSADISVKSPESSTKSPPPGTPPKKDFRSSLRSSRDTPIGSSHKSSDSKGDLEFQNVFGKLKKTQGDRFVPKDELKENVLGGKSALRKTDGPKKIEIKNEFLDSIKEQKKVMNVTGGPQKSQRKDEFKESILAKRKDMAASRAESGTLLNAARKSRETQEKEVPEAIQRRRGETRGARSTSGSDESAKVAAEMLARMGSTGGHAKKPSSDAVASPPPERKPRPIPRDLPNVPLKPRETIAKPSSFKGASTPWKKDEAAEEAARKEASPPPQAPRNKAGSLAARLNPGLAAIMSRGPPGMAPADDTGSDSSASAPAPAVETPKSEGKELTHATKGRARGPKRRGPPKKATDETTKDESPEKAAVAPEEQIPELEKIQSPPPPSKSPDPRAELAKSVAAKAKPATPVKSPSSSEDKDVSTKKATPSPIKIQSPSESRMSSRLEELAKGGPASPRGLASPTNASPNHRGTSPSSSPFVPRARSPFSSTGEPLEEDKPRRKSPIKLPTRHDEEQAHENAGLNRDSDIMPKTAPLSISASGSPEKASPVFPAKPKTAGLGISTASSPERGGSPSLPQKPNRAFSPLPKDDSDSPRSSKVPPPLSKKPELGGPRDSTPSTPVPIKSPRPKRVPQSHNAKLLAEHYGSVPELPEALTIDTAALISANPIPDASKFETTNFVAKELHSGSGKLMDVERKDILYCRSMYMFAHTRLDKHTNKQGTDVYFWVGSKVSEASVEDAQTFISRAARDITGSYNPSKPMMIRQGKEPAILLQALGGLVIFHNTRLFTSDAGAAPQQYLLCVRSHLGCVVMDEMDFTLKSFCSGFAYIVSSGKGPIYLWKGAGCTIDEYSSAKMFAMELGNFMVMPDEIEEGSESADFLSLFPTDPNSKTPPSMPRSAEHWKQKGANAEKYKPRLYSVSAPSFTKRGSTSSPFAGIANFASSVSTQFSSYFTTNSSNSNTLSSPSPVGTPTRRGSGFSLGFGSSFGAHSPVQISSNPGTPKNGAVDPDRNGVVVKEVAPFSKEDLAPDCVWVLDAWFEVYVLPGPLAPSPAIAMSLLLGQDYGILAASLEDRPVMPFATLVLEGVPRDARAIFRNWEDNHTSGNTEALMAGRNWLGGKLRVMPLASAVTAAKEEGGAGA